jgi:RNA polymerase subunit RPABC4/transcription elongation factor Spt4
MMHADISDSKRSLDALFASLDLEMAQSRSTGTEFDFGSTQESERQEFTTEEQNAMQLSIQELEEYAIQVDVRTWQTLYDRAKARDCTCPICIQQMAVSDKIGTKVRKSLKLLDCSHLYHAACLECFEQLGHDTCPVCRSKYKAMTIQYECFHCTIHLN